MTSKLRVFPGYKPHEQDGAFAELFKSLAQKFGRPKVELGISTCIEDDSRKGREYHPSAGEFTEYVRLADPGFRPRWKDPDPACKLCDGSGWKPVLNKENRSVVRCDCRRIERKSA